MAHIFIREIAAVAFSIKPERFMLGEADDGHYVLENFAELSEQGARKKRGLIVSTDHYGAEKCTNLLGTATLCNK